MKKKIFSTLLLVAFALASTSMFVSCKDYDDDINKNAKAIEELRATIKDLEGKLNDCKATCAAAHATFATKGELEALQEEIANLVTQQKLEEAIAAAKQTLQDAIDAKASQKDLDDLRTLVDGIDSKIAEHLKDYAKTSDVQAVQADLDRQKEIIALYLDELKKQLGVTDDQAAIDKLIELMNNAKAAMSKVGSFPADDLSQDEINQLRKIMEDYNSEINDNGFVNLNTLQKFLDKMVGSLVLKSDFRVLGVQAIEVPALVLQPTLRLVDPTNPATMELTENETWNYIHRNADTGEEYLAGAYDADAPIWVEFDPSTSYSTVRKDPWGFFMNYINNKKKDYVFYNNFEVPAKATYHINPSTANIDGAKLRFYTNTEFLVEEIESRDTRFEEGQSDFAIASPSVVDKTANVVKDGLLSVNVTLKNWTEYVKFLVQNADGNYIKNKWDIQGYGLNGSEEFSTLTDSINFIALQLQKGDTTVTSGYAAVAPALYHITNLADNAPEVAMPSYLDCGSKVGWSGKNGKGAHMYKTAMDAIANPATHTVPFDGSIDLADFVETHYTYLGAKAAWYTYDHTMTQEIFDQLGLKYHYEVINYIPTTGVEKTNQKEHIQNYASAPSVFYPRSVDLNTGKMIPDQTAKDGAIGKEPVIRVTLENAAGDVFEIGYVKLYIGGKEVANNVTAEVLDPVYVDCETSARLLWHQIESSILDDLHISKGDFEANYEVDGIKNFGGESGNDDLFNRFWLVDGKYVTVAEYKSELDKQLTRGEINKPKYDELLAEATVGSVFNTVTDVQEKQNNIIYWWFSTQKDFENLKLAAGISAASHGISTKDIVSYVRFKNKNTADTYIYVKIVIPAGKLFMYYGEVTGRELSKWYLFGSDVNPATEDAAREIHISVPTVSAHYGETNMVPLVSTEFKKNLHEFFFEDMIHFNYMDEDITKHFPNFASRLETRFEFINPVADNIVASFDAYKDDNNDMVWDVFGNSGSVYTLKVSGVNNDIIVATKVNGTRLSTPVPVVKLIDITNPKNGKLNQEIAIANNNYAFDIINYEGRYTTDKDVANPYFLEEINEARHTFTAFLKVSANACYNALLENATLRVRFLRPLNVMGNIVEVWDDQKEYTVNVADLVFMRDWHGLKDGDEVSTTKGLKLGSEGKPGIIPAAFYGVTEFYVDPEYILSDSGLGDGQRETKKPSEVDPSILRTIDQLSHIDGNLDRSMVNDGLKGVLKYVNRQGETKDCNIYVPISVSYAFGYRTQMVWGVIKVHGTNVMAKQN